MEFGNHKKMEGSSSSELLERADSSPPYWHVRSNVLYSVFLNHAMSLVCLLILTFLFYWRFSSYYIFCVVALSVGVPCVLVMQILLSLNKTSVPTAVAFIAVVAVVSGCICSLWQRPVMLFVWGTCVGQCLSVVLISYIFKEDVQIVRYLIGLTLATVTMISATVLPYSFVAGSMTTLVVVVIFNTLVFVYYYYFILMCTLPLTDVMIGAMQLFTWPVEIGAKK